MKPWLDDASSLADAIRHGEVKSADAVEASLEAIASSKLNALTMLDAEGARKQAQQIDDRIKKGEDPGLLAGQHHERMDGSGYYRGLPGSSLDRPARVLAAADACAELLERGTDRFR